MLDVYLIYQSNQSKMNASTKFGNISISDKAKNPDIKFHFSKVYYLICTEMHYKFCFNGLT